MTANRANTFVGLAGVIGCLVSLAGLWTQASWVSVWPLVAVLALLVAAGLIWAVVLPGPATDGWWALGLALAVTGEAAWEFLALPTDSVWIRWSVWVVVGSVVALFHLKAPSPWRSGLRIGLGAGVLAAAGLAVVFGVSVGTAEQASVLEAAGAMARFERSSSSDFLVWSVEDFWRGLPVMIASATAGGGLLGAAVRLVRPSS